MSAYSTYSEITSPQSLTPATPASSHSNTQSQNYDDSHTPRKFRLIDSIYNQTEEMELENELADELLLLGIDEPVCYAQAVKEKHWRAAMDSEISAIKKTTHGA